MPNIHLSRTSNHASAWDVMVDGGDAERFDCPIEALLRAKHLYEIVAGTSNSALLILR